MLKDLYDLPRRCIIQLLSTLKTPVTFALGSRRPCRPEPHPTHFADVVQCASFCTLGLNALLPVLPAPSSVFPPPWLMRPKREPTPSVRIEASVMVSYFLHNLSPIPMLPGTTGGCRVFPKCEDVSVASTSSVSLPRTFWWRARDTDDGCTSAFDTVASSEKVNIHELRPRVGWVRWIRSVFVFAFVRRSGMPEVVHVPRVG